MLSKSQIEFYGKRWGKVCDVNDWRQERGRLAREAAGPAFSAWHKLVWDLAEIHARQQGRSVTIDDLRRACTAAAAAAAGSRVSGLGSGADSSQTPDPRPQTPIFRSTKDLTNVQFNRLLTLFKLLEDPDKLDAVMEWEQPELADRRHLVNWIKSLAPEATILAISKNAWGTIWWEDEALDKLRWLARELNSRVKRRHGVQASACPDKGADTLKRELQTEDVPASNRPF